MSALQFSITDLFPLLDPASHSYFEAQAHSDLVDTHLGFKLKSVEHSLQLKSQSDFEKKEKWVGLDPAALLTPYTELRYMLHLLKLKDGDSVIDLGAGYGRMAFVMGAHFPLISFTGYEVAQERVVEGNRVLAEYRYENVKLIEQDLSAATFSIPPATVYFIYDFGTLNSVKKALLDLQEVSMKQKIILIGRGRRVRDQIERKEPWLSEIVPAEHHGRFSIYRS